DQRQRTCASAGASRSLVSRTKASSRGTSNGRRRGVTGLEQDLTDEGGREFQAETEVGPLLRGFQDPADAGQLDGGEQVMRGIVLVAALAQKDLLAPLGNHGHGWLHHAVNRCPRRGAAGQVKP